MNKTTVIELVYKIEKCLGSIRELEWNTSGILKLLESDYKNLTVRVEEISGGYEGAGEEYWMILRITEKLTDEKTNVTYWKIPGWYQSFHGSELEISDLFQVYPSEKVIRVWNKC